MSTSPPYPFLGQVHSYTQLSLMVLRPSQKSVFGRLKRFKLWQLISKQPQLLLVTSRHRSHLCNTLLNFHVLHVPFYPCNSYIHLILHPSHCFSTTSHFLLLPLDSLVQVLKPSKTKVCDGYIKSVAINYLEMTISSQNYVTQNPTNLSSLLSMQSYF